MAFTRSHATTTSTGRRPSFMDRVTGRTAATSSTTTSGTRRTGGLFSSSGKRGVGPAPTSNKTQTTGRGLFSGKGRDKTTAKGPMPMSHHKNARTTMGDRIHGAARKTAGMATGNPVKEQSGEIMMHGGANPRSGLGRSNRQRKAVF